MSITNEIIFAKTVAYSLTSFIDTYRHNSLMKRKISFRKFKESFIFSMFGGFIINTTCHKTIELCEKHKINTILSVALGVIFANVIKVPIIYNYRRIQIGMYPLTFRKFENIKNIMKIQLIEDIFEEGVKYTLVKKRIEEKKGNALLDSLLIFSLSYPFDLIKNQNIYNTKLGGNFIDFGYKCIHKNIQNFAYIKTINSVSLIEK